MVGWLVLLVAPVLADSLVMQAPLEAAREVQVFAGRSGVVAEVKGVLGVIVEEGDTLVLLDDSALRLEELSAHLVLQQTRSRYDRSLQLLVGGGISAQALEALDFDVQAAEIRYRMAQMDEGATGRGLCARGRAHRGRAGAGAYHRCRGPESGALCGDGSVGGVGKCYRRWSFQRAFYRACGTHQPVGRCRQRHLSRHSGISWCGEGA
jgi:hypothetical protein